MIKLDVFIIKDFDGNIITNFTIERKALDFVRNKRKLAVERLEVVLDPSQLKTTVNNEVKVLNWKEALYNHITSVLDSNGGNKALTARQLGMSVTNLTHRLKQFATMFGE